MDQHSVPFDVRNFFAKVKSRARNEFHSFFCFLLLASLTMYIQKKLCKTDLFRKFTDSHCELHSIFTYTKKILSEIDNEYHAKSTEKSVVSVGVYLSYNDFAFEQSAKVH